ncbi:MAG TPA: CHAT domain-containing protein [Chryseolinea sp.]|nr:CHAT domain-containing protein [Chryseolinea sp.]
MTKKFFFLSFILQLAISLCCYSQDQIKKIDSLILDSNFELAIAQVDQALIKISNQNQRIILENKKAEALIRAGRFKEAGNLLEQITLKSTTPYHLAIAQTNTGFLYLSQGRNDLALEAFQKALSNIEKENRQYSLEAAQVLSHLGNLYLTTGKYAQAEQQLDIALDIRQSLVKENSELIAASYNDLGLVYSTTDADKALDHYEKALAIYENIHGKQHPKIAIVSTNMGFVYRTIELYGDAILNFEAALTIWEKIYKQPHPTKAFILFNLGQTYLKMRNEKAAEGYYERALKMYRETFGKKHPEIATVLNSIGNLKLASRKFDEALDYYQAGLIANSSNFSEADLTSNPTLKNYYSGNTLLFSLLHKAEALESRYFGKSLSFKELVLASKTLQVCDTLIDNLRQQITNESDKISLGTIAAEVYGAGVRIAYEAGQSAIKKKPWFELAFYFGEKSKSAVLLEAISESNAKSFSGIPSDLLEQEKKLKAEIAVLAQKLSLKPSESEEKYLREIAFMLNREYENFTRKLETNFPAYFNLKFNVSAPSITELQSKLDHHTAIVSYFTDDKNNRTYIFQITAKRFHTSSHSIPEDFNKNITGLRNSLFFNEMETYKLSAAKLSHLLVPEKISSTIKQLVILPTGRLSIIPFETLFYKKNKKENTFASLPYMLRKYTIRYEFSAALILQKSKVQSNKSTSIFLCAPVTFKKPTLSALPGTESEVQEISRLFSSKNLPNATFIGDRANEKLVKESSLKNYSHLHFATHGVVDEVNPELSRIFLHPDSTNEDGNLFAAEIYNLELNANLVTLSACQTGLGKITKGEGVIGLSRALVYAGSKNVMVSFWSVADESTATLMKDFYRQLLENSSLNLSQHLRQAKINLINNEKYAAPYYWAPFILIGF